MHGTHNILKKTINLFHKKPGISQWAEWLSYSRDWVYMYDSEMSMVFLEQAGDKVTSFRPFILQIYSWQGISN